MYRNGSLPTEPIGLERMNVQHLNAQTYVNLLLRTNVAGFRLVSR